MLFFGLHHNLREISASKRLNSTATNFLHFGAGQVAWRRFLKLLQGKQLLTDDTDESNESEANIKGKGQKNQNNELKDTKTLRRARERQRQETIRKLHGILKKKKKQHNPASLVNVKSNSEK